MNTSSFNIIDNLIASLRLTKVLKYICKGDNVLDFGCGSQGYLLKSVAGKISKGVGLDFEVENKNIKNLSFKKFVFVDRLPFESGSFDKIFLLAVLEHVRLDVVDRLFNEFYRVLKKDGQIVLTTPTLNSKSFLEFLACKLHLISKDQIMDHQKYYTYNDILKLANLAKLRLIYYKLFQFGYNSIAVLSK